MNDEIASFLRQIRSADTDSAVIGEALIFCDRLDELGQQYRSGWMREMMAGNHLHRAGQVILQLFTSRCPRNCHYRNCEVCDGMGNVYLSEEYCCTPEKVEEVSGEGYARVVSGLGSGYIDLDWMSPHVRQHERLHAEGLRIGFSGAQAVTSTPARSTFASGLNPTLLRSGHAYVGMVVSGQLSGILPSGVCPRCYGFGFTLFYHMNGIKSYVQLPYLR